MATVLRRKFVPIASQCKLCLGAPQCISYSSSKQQTVQYPAIKPKYPNGSWEGMTPEEAWKWQEDIDAIDTLPTIEERLLNNHGARHQLYYFDVLPFSNVPDLLDYQEEITKTAKDQSLTVQTSVDKISKLQWRDICADIKDLLRNEFLHTQRLADKTLTAKEWEVKKRDMLTSALLHRVALLLAAEYPNIIQTDIERDVNVQTHWVRGGEKASPNVFCQVLHPQYGRVRYGYKQNVNMQFRSCRPLDTSHLNIDSFTSEYLSSQNNENESQTEESDPEKSELLEQQSITKLQAQYNPHIRGQYKLKYALPHQPGFLYGSPSEYVNLSVISPRVNSKNVESSLSKEAYNNSMVGTGLVHSFATAYAMAHYQGYDMHHDIVSPMLTQTLVTDGRLFTPITYQLNTLRLYTPNTANSRYNTYSEGETTQLYHEIDDNGTVIGFNDQCVKMIAKCMLAQQSTEKVSNPHLSQDQMKTPISGELLPYLPVYPWKGELAELAEGSVTIPTFMRYNKHAQDPSEWDLCKSKTKQRYFELKHEAFITKGPYHDSYEPPARGKVILDQYFANVRKQEREKRIKWRDEVVKYKKQQVKPSS